MPRIYLPDPIPAHGVLEAPAAAAHHIANVLRLAQGDSLTLFDGRGYEHTAVIQRISKSGVTLTVADATQVDRESPLRVALAQGISSGERMDYTVQKSVELGVTAIQPLMVERSVVRLSPERAAKRVAHWQAIAVAACEQCGRNRIPTVHPLVDAERYSGGEGSRILLSPAAELTFSQACKAGNGPFTIAAGPEAGFSAEEVRAFLNAGYVPARIGPRVLRTETAGLAALAALNALKGDF